MIDSQRKPRDTRQIARAALALIMASFILLGLAASASAAKRVVDTIGDPAVGGRGGEFAFNGQGGVAVNETGAGGVSPGELYVADSGNRRVQEFTSAGQFVRAWGMGVLTDDPTSFDICTEAGKCQQGLNLLSPYRHPGAIIRAEGIAVDQATGNVYVTDQELRRVEIFSATGQPQGAFGWGVVDGSSELQFCAVGSTCQAALNGGDAGGALTIDQTGTDLEISPTGELYVVGPDNRRVDVFKPLLNGTIVTGISFQRAFGWDVVRSGPGDTGTDEQVRLTVRATGGNYFLRVNSPEQVGDTDPIPFNADAAAVEAELNETLAVIGGTVSVSGGPGDATGSTPYVIAFSGSLAGDDIELKAFSVNLTGGVPATVTMVEPLTDGGGYEVCTSDDVCKRAPASEAATEAGHFNQGPFITGNPRDVAIDRVSGDVYVLERGGSTAPRIHRFDSESAPLDGAFGAAALLDTFGSDVAVQNIALDPDSGHLLVTGRGSATSGHVRVLELDSSGDAVALHGVDLPDSLTLIEMQGIASAPAAAGGNLYLLSNNVNTLIGVTVLAEAKPEIDLPVCHQTDADLSGTVFSDNQQVSYRFEYVTEAVFEAGGFAKATNVPASDVSVGPAPAEIDVSQKASGLSGSQKYRFRLVATRGGVSRISEEATCTTLPAPPAVSGAGALPDGSGAILRAKVNPQNQPSSFSFQYTTEGDFLASGWANAFQTPQRTLNAGGAPILVAEEVSGLGPGTAYRFRALAENSTGNSEGKTESFTTLPEEPQLEGTNCSNKALRSGPSAMLPDCRAYELVSPPAAANIIGNGSRGYVSVDGESASFSAIGSFAGAPQSTVNTYVSRRGASGWTTHAIVPPFLEQTPPNLINLFLQNPLGFSEDFTRAYISTENGIDPLDVDENSDVYLREPDGTFKWVSSNLAGQLVGNSADARRAVFQGVDGNLYESLDGASPCPLSMLPDGSLAPDPLLGDSSALAGLGVFGTARGAVSADGSRIFFESDVNTVGTTTRLWVREANPGCSPSPADTHPIANEAPGSIFAGASRDGGRVFFTTPAALDPADDNGDSDLYRFDLDADIYTRISPDASEGDPDPRVRRHRGIVLSAGGSRAYFVAQSVLTEEPNANGQSATEGIDNVYVWDDGELHFVASPQSGAQSASSGLMVQGLSGSVSPGPGPYPAEWDLSAAGSHLAFATRDTLLSSDTDASIDIYVYDLADESLGLASVGPRGGSGDFDVKLGEGLAGGVTHVARFISDDGRYLFFQTAEQLVTRDSNDKMDVYERDLQSGRTWLISSGAADLNAVLQGISADGTSVVFTDPRPLVPQDPDGERSVYAARIGGGFAPQVSAPCVGEGCKGLPPSAPSLAPPTSSSPGGSGNLRPKPKARRCVKGTRKVRRAGKARCVKAQRKQKRQGRNGRAGR